MQPYTSSYQTASFRCPATGVVVVCCLCMLSLTGSRHTFAQSASTNRPGLTLTELVLQADAPCLVLVDSIEVARMNTGDVKRVSLRNGKRLVQAIGENPVDRWEKTVLVEPGIRRVVMIGMKRVIAEREHREISEAMRRQMQEEKAILMQTARASLFDTEAYILLPPGLLKRSTDGGVPGHTIAITKPIAIGRYEVTQAQWESMMGGNPSDTKGAFHPVESVSWFEVQAFLDSLNASSTPGMLYRLPTEAEWEYACKAGEPESVDLDADAWYLTNASERTHPVGKKAPNTWGLYDMRGNVGEWVMDWYGLYDPKNDIDPVYEERGRTRVVRGGSWWSPAEITSCGYRGNLAPDFKATILGFRLVRELMVDF